MLFAVADDGNFIFVDESEFSDDVAGAKFDCDARNSANEDKNHEEGVGGRADSDEGDGDEEVENPEKIEDIICDDAPDRFAGFNLKSVGFAA